MSAVETIAIGREISELRRLRRRYGKRRLRKRKGLATVRLQDGTVHKAGLMMKKSKKLDARFAVCIKNRGYEASLEVGKLYRVVPDDNAAKRGYLRIVDESGDDYGYAADRFFASDFPKPLKKALLRVAS